MPQLKKKLTLYGLTMIAIGSCIGAGIFATPNGVVQAVPHQGWALLTWVLGGLVALTGALTFAELGGMFPKAGGVYVFLKEAYGDAVGFLYGWVTLLVINTGALAALGLIFASYMNQFIPGMGENGELLLAILVIGGLTALNALGIDTSQLFANLFSGLKLLALAGIVVVGLIFYQETETSLQLGLMENRPDNLLSAMLTGLIGVLFSIGGWHHASYLAGEAVNAQKTVPRAMIFGTLVVTVIYLLANLAYMMLLPLPTLQQSAAVASDSLMAVTPLGGKIAAIIIAISIFGSIGIYTMSAPRIYFAMAKDGIFFKQLAHLHPKYQTPVNAMIVQAVWAILLLVLWQTFHNLISYVTFMDIGFMALAGFSVILFRRNRKGVERPYKVPGYPIVPLIFIGISAAFVINTLFEQPTQALAGLVLCGTGLGVYYWFTRTQR